MHDPLRYNPNDLCEAFIWNPEHRVHIHRIIIRSARYCKQEANPQHEFILLQVADALSTWSNFLLVDRHSLNDNITRIKVTLMGPSSSNSNNVEDRLLVSYYGDKDSMLRRCDLLRHKVMEQVDFTKTLPILLYEFLFMASVISSKQPHAVASRTESCWFIYTSWAGLAHLAPSATWKCSNQTWRKRVFHQSNLCELASIILDTRRRLTAFCAACKSERAKVVQ